jgi:hypothetical protein
MKVLRILLLLVASFGLSLAGGFIVSSFYQHRRYPGVEDTDGLLDIGTAFLSGFVAVGMALAACFLARHFRQRRV